jgi:hypothetical protein
MGFTEPSVSGNTREPDDDYLLFSDIDQVDIAETLQTSIWGR